MKCEGGMIVNKILGFMKDSDFVAGYPNVRVSFPSEPVDPFFNINTPDDAADAERIAVQHCDDGGP